MVFKIVLFGLMMQMMTTKMMKMTTVVMTKTTSRRKRIMTMTTMKRITLGMKVTLIIKIIILAIWLRKASTFSIPYSLALCKAPKHVIIMTSGTKCT